MAEALLPDQLTEDKFLNGLVSLHQPQTGFRAGLESVFLAAAVPARAGDHVLEPGMGAGAAALCLATRVAGARVTGLELSSNMVLLADHNVQQNKLGSHVTTHCGDVATPPVAIKAQQFDHVMMNPPFDRAGSGRVSPDKDKARANQEGTGSLSAFLEFGIRRLKSDGSLTIIHRAERLDEIMAGLADAGVGGLMVYPLWPRAGVEARRVIVQGRKGSRTGARVLPGLVLHEGTESHAFTPAAEAILRHGAALTLGA